MLGHGPEGVGVEEGRGRLGLCPPRDVERLVAELEAGGERALEAPERPLQDGVEVVGDDGLLAVPLGARDRDVHRAERLIGGDRRGLGDPGEGLAPVPAVAGLVAQAKIVAVLVVDPDGADVDVGLLVVVVGQAVEVPAVDGRNGLLAPEHHGEAVVGQVVLALVEEAPRDLDGGAEADGERRRDAPALDVDLVALGHVVGLAHHVEAQRGHRADGLVDVGLPAEEHVGAAGEGPLVEAARLGGLADLIDDAAGRPAPEQQGRRPLEDLDGLQVEGVARVHAHVADAVEEDVGARVEAAQGEVVALGAAALTGDEADAGDVAQRVAQREGGLLAHQLLGHDGDRLRVVGELAGDLEEIGVQEPVLAESPLGRHVEGGPHGGARTGRLVHR